MIIAWISLSRFSPPPRFADFIFLVILVTGALLLAVSRIDVDFTRPAPSIAFAFFFFYG